MTENGRVGRFDWFDATLTKRHDFHIRLSDRLWIEMKNAVRVVSQTSDAVPLVCNNVTCILSRPCPHAGDSVTSNWDYLTVVTDHLEMLLTLQMVLKRMMFYGQSILQFV